MITKAERYDVYTKTFQFMISSRFDYLPSPLEDICSDIHIPLVPLSHIVTELGVSENEVFRTFWKNENGHLSCYTNSDGVSKFKIAYNDNPNHIDRKRFTIAEEIAHMILGHYKHEMYLLSNPRAWDQRVYRKHEESARIAAGLMLCPPPVFYTAPSYLNANDIRYLCGVSEPCATVREDILTKYQPEIVRHPMYRSLEAYLQNVIVFLPCHICGGSPVIPEAGVCASCHYDLMDDAMQRYLDFI